MNAETLTNIEPVPAAPTLAEIMAIANPLKAEAENNHVDRTTVFKLCKMLGEYAKRGTPIHVAVNALNEATKMDPEVMASLLAMRVSVAADSPLIQHPRIVVFQDNEGQLSLGALGFLNAIVGSERFKLAGHGVPDEENPTKFKSLHGFTIIDIEKLEKPPVPAREDGDDEDTMDEVRENPSRDLTEDEEINQLSQQGLLVHNSNGPAVQEHSIDGKKYYTSITAPEGTTQGVLAEMFAAQQTDTGTNETTETAKEPVKETNTNDDPDFPQVIAQGLVKHDPTGAEVQKHEYEGETYYTSPNIGAFTQTELAELWAAEQEDAEPEKV
jgi:hypothetical protein